MMPQCKIAEKLGESEELVRYLNFETFQAAGLRFSGTRCYDQTPSKFPVHSVGEGGEQSLSTICMRGAKTRVLF